MMQGYDDDYGDEYEDEYGASARRDEPEPALTLFPAKLIDLAQQVHDHALRIGARIAIAESCTGGLISGCMTEIPGASKVLDRCWVTYSNESKEEELDVNRDVLMTQGAVSPGVAEEMVKGALLKSRAHFALSATGIAGPNGGTAGKPVGLVYLGIARRSYDGNHAIAHKRLALQGMDRTETRLTAVYEALMWLDMTMPEALGT